jgi:Calcineurin-like phosphoesterase superfamily domain
MRTAIVSDLHLGNAYGEDLLRDAAVRRVLLEEVAGADRLVLLGDVIELRELPLPSVLDAARPFFEELGEALPGRPVLLVPGNHDHRLAEPLLEQLALARRSLELEQRAEPAGETATRIAAWLGDARLELAYPGVWLREDVYATHGHYMDCHMSLPRIECLAAAAAMRVGDVSRPAAPADYERILQPIYSLSFSLAQSRLMTPGALVSTAVRATRPSERVWLAASGSNGVRRGRLRRAAQRVTFAAAIPAGVWSANRLLGSRFSADLSAAAISRSGIEAAAELVGQMRVEAAHTVTGHTHRGGPWDADPAWTLSGGGLLHNTGSWVFASAFHRPGTPPGPYWPGTVTWLEDDAPPRRVRLLLDRPREELRGAVRRIAAATPAA